MFLRAKRRVALIGVGRSAADVCTRQMPRRKSPRATHEKRERALGYKRKLWMSAKRALSAGFRAMGRRKEKSERRFS
jgi:hypothetical protein